ncbi:MAG TPA: hypothetical protein VFQ25_07875 [Ktedonobacterales bacterium]|nr:hypothetical protein [Ktedonobacterales bacterium]
MDFTESDSDALMAIFSSSDLTPRASGAGHNAIEAVIVGAGVSGLLAAHELLRRRPGSRVILVDAGLPLAERRAQPTPPMGGEGGAGLYLGGRLYLGAASLPVMPPVSVPPAMCPVIEGDAYVRRAQEVDALLRDLGARAEWVAEPPEPLARAIQQAREAGIEYITSYPSRRLSPDDKTTVLAGLRQWLTTQGARFIFGARVTVATRADGGFLLTLDSSGAPADAPPIPERLITRALLLAPGRYGAEWLTRVASDVGAEVVALPRAFGVRLEMPVSVYEPLASVNPDPRLQAALADDAYIKTYATCPGGAVSPVARYNALVASGVPALRPADRGPNTTVAILAQPGVTGAAGAWRGGEKAARALNQRAPGRLTIQRLEDARLRRPTSAEALAASPIRPSDASAAPGALHDLYPDAYWAAFEDFLARLERLAPGVTSSDTLLYGPAEERFWHFPTDAHMQTTTPGLFVAGDGPGQSQGIIQASVAGLLAGEGLASALAGAAR